MKTRSAVLATARHFLGVHEVPDGSNRTIIGALFGWNGVPWCAEFVCMCLLRVGFDIRKNASAHGLAEQLVHAGWQKIAPKDVRSGDIVKFVFSHIGFCEARKDSGRVITIEGNHGNSVARAIRANSSIDYGVRPPYTPEVPAPKPAHPEYTTPIRKGDKRKALVAFVQQRANVWLRHLHYPHALLATDGVFGPVTAAAILWLRNHFFPKGAKEVPVVGPRTFAWLLTNP